MVTMKDVAKLAGVSHGTVSNVVNGVKNVSVDKIKKVEAAMEALGYKPNSAARNLKMEFTRQIDLVVPNMITGEFLELYEAIRKCAEKENYTLNLKVTDGIAMWNVKSCINLL
ncbi:MAG: LacI family DNA-binding transcriptional regulator [Eubacterium sp.]